MNIRGLTVEYPRFDKLINRGEEGPHTIDVPVEVQQYDDRKISGEIVRMNAQFRREVASANRGGSSYASVGDKKVDVFVLANDRRFKTYDSTWSGVLERVLDAIRGADRAVAAKNRTLFSSVSGRKNADFG